LGDDAGALPRTEDGTVTVRMYGVSPVKDDRLINNQGTDGMSVGR
jgi:hypothetical protein